MKRKLHFLSLLLLSGFSLQAQTTLTESTLTTPRGTSLRVTGGTQMIVPGATVNSVFNNAVTNNSFTIEFWAKVNTDPATSAKLIGSNGRLPVSNFTSGIAFEFSATNKLNVVIGNNSGSWSSITDQGLAWNVGEWNHVTVTAENGGFLKYYVNGTFVAQVAFTQYVENTWGLGLGYSSPYPANTVQAELDDLRIWKKALTPAEILQNMNYELAGTETGLGIYYNFDHTVGNTNSITSNGTTQFEITLGTNYSLQPSTSPVANIASDFQNVVKGKWSKNNTVNVVGLSVLGTITDFNTNVVVGKKDDVTTDVVPGSTMALSYLKGGWEINPLNFATADLQVDLAAVFTNSAAFDATVDHYELIKGDPNGTYQIVGTATSASGIVTFTNVALSGDTYYLGYILTSVLGNNAFNSINDTVSLYPNPTEGNTIIEVNGKAGSNVNVTVFDIVGRKVLDIQKQAIGSNQKIELDLTGIAGEQLFVIQVQVGDQIKTFKLLKK
ncbi:LamG domain-containing protein [Flavobacterium terrigena]|uniref:Por secretion system C-terminal sorting domain-containing protein n=1 Tax=Flavobacterium terrigena TaxID=402734 RepID=A0A1H6VK41_9FLAO|nr:LamG domain-containing protein [Flavobacterium terrigena]SEJ04953.1 Por secretion system C-terminal sorting domain-containing protein [Flavobacterium terrigena]